MAPNINRLEEVRYKGITSLLRETMDELGKLRVRIEELEGNGSQRNVDYQSIVEIERRLGESESTLEDIGEAVNGLREKVGAVSENDHWKFVGTREDAELGLLVHFAKVEVLLDQRVEVILPIEHVRFLAEKTYRDGTPQLDQVRLDTTGKTIPLSLEEAIESVGGGEKSSLKYAKELRAVLVANNQQEGGVASELLPLGAVADHSQGPVGAQDLLKAQPLSSEEQAVLEYLQRNGRLAKNDLRVLRPLLPKGVNPTEIMIKLGYRELITKLVIEGTTYYIPKIEEGDGSGREQAE